MILRQMIYAICHMTFGADKIRILLSCLDFEIQSAPIVKRLSNVTAVSAAARFDCNLHGLRIDGTERRRRDIMTVRTIKIRMHAAFVTKRAGGLTPAPACQHHGVSTHRRCALPIDVREPRPRLHQFVTALAVLRLGWNSRVSVVTGKAGRVAGGNGFERSLLEPEVVADIF